MNSLFVLHQAIRGIIPDIAEKARCIDELICRVFIEIGSCYMSMFFIH